MLAHLCVLFMSSPLSISAFLSRQQKYPDFRQAEVLKGLVDDAIVRDGVIGVGIAGAVAVGAALLIGAMRR